MLDRKPVDPWPGPARRHSDGRGRRLRRSGDRVERRRGRPRRHRDSATLRPRRPRADAATAATTPAAASRGGDAGATAPVKAEGWGTLKGQVVFGGDTAAPKVLVEKGKAAKDPEVCAKDAPIVSERLVVDGATKGVKNVLVYIPKPTRVNHEAKKAAAAPRSCSTRRSASSSPTSWAS